MKIIYNLKLILKKTIYKVQKHIKCLLWFKAKLPCLILICGNIEYCVVYGLLEISMVTDIKKCNFNM